MLKLSHFLRGMFMPFCHVLKLNWFNISIDSNIIHFVGIGIRYFLPVDDQFTSLIATDWENWNILFVKFSLRLLNVFVIFCCCAPAKQVHTLDIRIFVYA